MIAIQLLTHHRVILTHHGVILTHHRVILTHHRVILTHYRVILTHQSTIDTPQSNIDTPKGNIDTPKGNTDIPKSKIDMPQTIRAPFREHGEGHLEGHSLLLTNSCPFKLPCHVLTHTNLYTITPHSHKTLFCPPCVISQMKA